MKWLKSVWDEEGPFSKVLEIGCHDGFITRWMLSHPRPPDILVGIDPSEHAIDTARVMAGQEIAPLDRSVYLKASWEELYEDMDAVIRRDSGRWMLSKDFRIPDKWDMIVCFEMIEHIEVREAINLVTWMKHRLRDRKSVALICTPSADGQWGVMNPDKHHISLYTQQELWTLIGDVCADFEVASSSDWIMARING